jgi:hypothetical protein
MDRDRSTLSESPGAAESPQTVNPTLNAGETEPMLYCPVCSLRLSERRCKLFCERCGYYMSCADYY